MGLDASQFRKARIALFLPALLALISLSARAFNSSLQPEEIQDAYSLGQTTNHEDLANFLNQYEHDFKYPSDHPTAFLQTVEFQTPYEQIVLRTLRTAGYTKFQAEEDYRANPRRVIVRVIAALKTNYTGPEPSADGFQVVVSQTDPIEPRKVTSNVTCNPYNLNETPAAAACIAYTREILLEFNARQFAPGKATVKVMLPFGESQETTYKLDELK